MKTGLIIAVVLIGVCSHAQVFELGHPPSLPEILAEGIINTSYSERDFALSPNGTELFYTLQAPKPGIFQTILYMHKDESGRWSKPEIAPFAGNYSDLEPAFTTDGERLFFSSNRPVSGDQPKDFDIWYAEKKDGKWGEPKNIGSPVNTNADEYYPSVTASGNLYFTATRKNAIGKEDIFLAKWEAGKYNEPEPLDTAVNTATYEFNAFVSPDERTIIFSSYGRKDDKGGGDLYMSVKNENGQWQPAKNLSSLNSTQLDYCPFISFDKKIFFFTSERNNLKKSFSNRVSYPELIGSFSSVLNGGGNIYWMSYEKVMELFR